MAFRASSVWVLEYLGRVPERVGKGCCRGWFRTRDGGLSLGGGEAGWGRRPTWCDGQGPQGHRSWRQGRIAAVGVRLRLRPISPEFDAPYDLRARQGSEGEVELDFAVGSVRVKYYCASCDRWVENDAPLPKAIGGVELNSVALERLFTFGQAEGQVTSSSPVATYACALNSPIGLARGPCDLEVQTPLTCRPCHPPDVRMRQGL